MNKKNLADFAIIVGSILASSDVESVVYFASVSDSCGVVAQTAAGAMLHPVEVFLPLEIHSAKRISPADVS